MTTSHNPQHGFATPKASINLQCRAPFAQLSARKGPNHPTTLITALIDAPHSASMKSQDQIRSFPTPPIPLLSVIGQHIHRPWKQPPSLDDGQGISYGGSDWWKDKWHGKPIRGRLACERNGVLRARVHRRPALLSSFDDS
jgi:hypothetical protein